MADDSIIPLISVYFINQNNKIVGRLKGISKEESLDNIRPKLKKMAAQHEFVQIKEGKVEYVDIDIESDFSLEEILIKENGDMKIYIHDPSLTPQTQEEQLSKLQISSDIQSSDKKIDLKEDEQLNNSEIQVGETKVNKKETYEQIKNESEVQDEKKTLSNSENQKNLEFQSTISENNGLTSQSNNTSQEETKNKKDEEKPPNEISENNNPVQSIKVNVEHKNVVESDDKNKTNNSQLESDKEKINSQTNSNKKEEPKKK